MRRIGFSDTPPGRCAPARSCALELGAALAIALVSCQPRPSPPISLSAPLAPLHRGPLTDYVPAAGLRWMVAGRPLELARSPALLAEVQRMLTRGRLEAFTSSSGVDLRELPEGCIAGFDYGTLYLARTGKSNALVRSRFEARLVSDPVVRSRRHDVWRVTGLVANTPESLLVVDQDFTAFAVGDPLLARIVESFVTGRFRKSKPALGGAALAGLPVGIHDAPLRFYAPGPFTGEWARAADGVLTRAFAFGASVQLPTPSVLQIRLVLSGSFGPDLEETRTRLIATWRGLQLSAIGHLLRLHESLEPAVIDVRNDAASVTVSYPVSSLMRGISAAVVDDVQRIMGSVGGGSAYGSEPTSN